MNMKTLSMENETLIQDYLDLAAHDSENLERTMGLLSDDCTWVMEPTGDIFRGKAELRSFVRTAMGGRTYQSGYQVEITGWFTDGENLCVEYTHGAVLSGAFLAGFKPAIKPGITRYCLTFHMRDGKFDQVHEYINATSFWIAAGLPLALKYLRRLVDRDTAKNKPHPFRPLGITIAGVFMILAGLAEVVTGFTHNFFGITTSGVDLFTFSGAAIGLMYAAAGILVLTMKKWAAGLAIVLLGIDVLGRIALVATGLYPVDSARNTFAIIAGTAIAAIIAIYIGWRWKSFR